MAALPLQLQMSTQYSTTFANTVAQAVAVPLGSAHVPKCLPMLSIEASTEAPYEAGPNRRVSTQHPMACCSTGPGYATPLVHTPSVALGSFCKERVAGCVRSVSSAVQARLLLGKFTLAQA